MGKDKLRSSAPPGPSHFGSDDTLSHLNDLVEGGTLGRNSLGTAAPQPTPEPAQLAQPSAVPELPDIYGAGVRAMHSAQINGSLPG